MTVITRDRQPVVARPPRANLPNTGWLSLRVDNTSADALPGDNTLHVDGAGLKAAPGPG